MNLIQQLENLKQRLTDAPEFRPIYEGMKNFVTGSKKFEALAKKRYFFNCKNCEYFGDEQNDLLKVEDKKITELSNKVCNECGGCVLSYKLRQNNKPCKFWTE